MQNIYENWGFYHLFWNIALPRLSGRVLMVFYHAYEIPRSPGRFFFALKQKGDQELSGPLTGFTSTQIYLPQPLAFRVKWCNHSLVSYFMSTSAI